MNRDLYWDTSVFLCFLNAAEKARREICEDILRHAQKGDVRIYTSTLTIVEVIRPKKVSIPNARLLTPEEIDKIEGMFRWSWLEKIPPDQQIAFTAVALARDYGLWPPDAIHAATAIRKKADVLQAWDRDFSPVGHLVSVGEPLMMSDTKDMFGYPPIGPTPEGFKDR